MIQQQLFTVGILCEYQFYCAFDDINNYHDCSSKAFPNPYGTTRTKNPKFCPDCGKMVMGSVSKHIRQVHLKEVNCICDYCNYSCFRKDNMINHLQKHLMKVIATKMHFIFILLTVYIYRKYVRNSHA